MLDSNRSTDNALLLIGAITVALLVLTLLGSLVYEEFRNESVCSKDQVMKETLRDIIIHQQEKIKELENELGSTKK